MTKKLTVTTKITFAAIASLLSLFLFVACSKDDMPNQELADQVDLERFMGKWYVHGHSPTMIDKRAFAATETYEFVSEEKIKTTYEFRNKSLDGPKKTYKPVGRVLDTESNSEWRMKFFGVFSAPYYILYVDENYETTVIGHPGKEMAWIMTRSAEISEAQYEKLKDELVSRDYNLSDFRRVLHR